MVGIGITAFLFLYLAFKLEKQHFLMQLLAISFALYCIILLGKTGLDSRSTCDLVLQNQTTISNTTYFAYNTSCYVSTSETSITFTKIGLWFFRIFFVYLFVYLFYSVLEHWGALAWIGGKLKSGKI